MDSVKINWHTDNDCGANVLYKVNWLGGSQMVHNTECFVNNLMSTTPYTFDIIPLDIHNNHFGTPFQMNFTTLGERGLIYSREVKH